MYNALSVSLRSGTGSPSSRAHLLPDPTIPQLRRRGNQTSYEIPTRSTAIPVCLRRNLNVYRTILGSTFVDPLPTFAARGLLMSLISLISLSVFWAQNPVKQSVTLSLDQDSRPAGCARNVTVSLVNNLLDNSY